MSIDAKLDFIVSLRNAIRLLNPSVVIHDNGNGENLERGMRRAALWLNPAIVRDFDLSQFPELNEDERAELASNVETFREAAEGVTANDPPTPEQYESGLESLLEIVESLRAYVLLDKQMFDVWRKLDESLRSLPYVIAVFPEIKEDSSGDESVFVSIILDDAVSPESADFQQLTSEAKERARNAALAVHPQLWPYINFMSASDFKESMDCAS